MISVIRSIVLAAIFAAGLAFLLFAGLIASPVIDEHVGFFTERATNAIRSYSIDGVPLGRMIDREFTGVHWRAYHQDLPTQTFVECTAKPRSGGPARRMLWYVDERPVWHHGLSLKIVRMTVLNGEALEVTPHLFDPGAGFGLDHWRHGVELP
jgi:hypothetical protein